MGCNATFAIAANEENMKKVVQTIADNYIAEEVYQKELLAKDLKTEVEAGAKALQLYYPCRWRDPSFRMDAFGTTYVTYFTLTGFLSTASIDCFAELLSLLPEGEYGVAFSFAWDHSPEAVAINGPWELFHGGGEDISEELHILSEDYLWSSSERGGLLRSKGWRLKDLTDSTDYVTVARAASLRHWRPDKF